MTTYSLYNGSVLLEFDEAKHVYLVKGEIVPSVTGIKAPNPALQWWSANMARDHILENLKPGIALDEIAIQELAEGARKAHSVISKKAASIGTLAHEACEVFARTGSVAKPPIHPQARASFETFVKWWEDHDVKLHDAEKKVYSRNYGYAGTADLFCEVDGVRCIVDLKTSNAIYDDYFMQLAAYAHARNEEMKHELRLEDCLPYEDGWIVRLPKDGGPVETRHCDRDGLSKAFGAFTGLLEYYTWAKSS